jgi:class 3 adenylate cyclase/tetratricopeptide (TPR) repeat protein
MSKSTLPYFDDAVELIAARLHELWASQRKAEGWSVGDRRDDAQKIHPLIIPYKRLPASEKALNRAIAEEALRLSISIGSGFGRSITSVPAFPASIAHTIAVGKPGELRGAFDPDSILASWRAISEKGGRLHPPLYEAIGNAALQRGSPLIAYDIFSAAVANWPGNVRLQTLLGLSLAETGATEKARAILDDLCSAGKANSEIIGILARTNKDMAWQTGDFSFLQNAQRLYAKGYAMAVSRRGRGWRDNAIYTGINYAATSLLAGQKAKAIAIAKEVSGLCIGQLKQEVTYWTLASLGEAAVILARWDEAEKYYRQAGEIGKGKRRHLASTRRQARRLLQCQGEKNTRFDFCFNIPRVTVFAGHMVDLPDRATPRFPPALEKAVRRAIAKRLGEMNIAVGFSSAACGSDILFLEEMAALKRRSAGSGEIEINVVIPCALDAFRRVSVDVAKGEWGTRFERALRNVDNIVEASPLQNHADAIDFNYSNHIQDGLGQLRAKAFDAEMTPLVVWNGKEGDGGGGTASMVSLWRKRGLEPSIIDIEKLRAAEPISLTSRKARRTPAKNKTAMPSSQNKRRICAMLFGDVVGYSRLEEEKTAPFVNKFMGLIAAVIEPYETSVLFRNTWGDALHLTFSSIEMSGLFALELCDRIAETDWSASDLPADLNIRIGLHAGPVGRYLDPVQGEHLYCGTHVSRTARIEQITPPGYVYASQEFAALAASMNIESFAVDYAGTIGLPKHYGEYPLYHIRRMAWRRSFERGTQEQSQTRKPQA